MFCGFHFPLTVGPLSPASSTANYLFNETANLYICIHRNIYIWRYKYTHTRQISSIARFCGFHPPFTVGPLSTASSTANYLFNQTANVYIHIHTSIKIKDGVYTKSTRAHTYRERIREWLCGGLRGGTLDISRCLGGAQPHTGLILSMARLCGFHWSVSRNHLIYLGIYLYLYLYLYL